MMTLFVKWFVKNRDEVSNPNVKKAYAVLSSVVGILLNLFLCAAKITIGLFSNSVAISADGFNNLSDAGTSLVSFLGFKIAKYGGGNTHLFGHGRIEWIMSIFTSIAVLLMGIKLAGDSAASIASPDSPVFSMPALVVLLVSILVKVYMYCYNKRFSKITGSETLKATAADCISDSLSTAAVFISTTISYITHLEIDGYCGVLVSVFIIFAGVKSLWEVLGRIMGQSADQEMADAILQIAGSYPEIIAVHDLMLHDYGFGYFVVSMHTEGYSENSRQLYTAANQIAYDLKQKFHCDSFIQVDYVLEDKTLKDGLMERIYTVLNQYSDEIEINNFRLIESDPYVNVAFDMVYPAKLQKSEEDICNDIKKEIESEYSKCRTVIKGIIRRERFRLHR